MDLCVVVLCEVLAELGDGLDEPVVENFRV
jgi:hypothetical protein